MFTPRQGRHDRDPDADLAQVALVHRRLHVRADPRQRVGLVAYADGLGGGQEEPAAPKLIIPFQTIPIIELGTSRRQNRSHLVRRNMRAASSSSVGWVIREWYMLNVMFQACDVKMAKIDAHSRPSTEPGNRAMRR